MSLLSLLGMFLSFRSIGIRLCRSGSNVSSGLDKPLFEVDQDNVVVDCVKLAEDAASAGSHIVVRLYESMGGRGQVSLKRWVIILVVIRSRKRRCVISSKSPNRGWLSRRMAIPSRFHSRRSS